MENAGLYMARARTTQETTTSSSSNTMNANRRDTRLTAAQRNNLMRQGKCFHCGQFGNIAKFCPNRQRQGTQGRAQGGTQGARPFQGTYRPQNPRGNYRTTFRREMDTMGEEASAWERMGQEEGNGYKAPYSTADSGISNQEEARGAAAAS